MALGYFSGKKGAFSGADARILNKEVLNYALPAALFVSIVKPTAICFRPTSNSLSLRL